MTDGSWHRCSALANHRGPAPLILRGAAPQPSPLWWEQGMALLSSASVRLSLLWWKHKAKSSQAKDGHCCKRISDMMGGEHKGIVGKKKFWRVRAKPRRKERLQPSFGKSVTPSINRISWIRWKLIVIFEKFFFLLFYALTAQSDRVTVILNTEKLTRSS